MPGKEDRPVSTTKDVKSALGRGPRVVLGGAAARALAAAGGQSLDSANKTLGAIANTLGGAAKLQESLAKLNTVPEFAKFAEGMRAQSAASSLLDDFGREQRKREAELRRAQLDMAEATQRAAAATLRMEEEQRAAAEANRRHRRLTTSISLIALALSAASFVAGFLIRGL
jgi:hypothetical protein